MLLQSAVKNRNFKIKSRKEETFVLYHLQRRKSGDGGAYHWLFQSIGAAQGAVSAARAALGAL